MQITFVTRKFRNVERNLHCDVLHITTVRVARLVLDCNGVFAIKAYTVKAMFTYRQSLVFPRALGKLNIGGRSTLRYAFDCNVMRRLHLNHYEMFCNRIPGSQMCFAMPGYNEYEVRHKTPKTLTAFPDMT